MKYLIYPLLTLALTLHSQTVSQSWEFTEDGITGFTDLISEEGTNATFLGTDTVANDGGFTISRGAGNSGDVSLGGSFSEANTSSLTLSITLASMNVGTAGGTNDFFKVNLRNDASNTRYGGISLTEHTAGLRLIADKGDQTTAVAGVAVGAPSTPAITYGITYDFLNDIYTTWIGTPTSDQSTWNNRFNANYTGAWNIGTNVMDSVQWSISDFTNANVAVIDQVQISTTPVPEPQAYASLVGILVLGAALLRRFRS